jgi:hypothetical protein
MGKEPTPPATQPAYLTLGGPAPTKKRLAGGLKLTTPPKQRRREPKAAHVPTPVRAARRVNGSSGRPAARGTAASRGGDSGDDPPDPPAGRPRGDGAARLLYDLVVSGLDPEAARAAAALVIRLDEDARTKRQAVAS